MNFFKDNQKILTSHTLISVRGVSSAVSSSSYFRKINYILFALLFVVGLFGNPKISLALGALDVPNSSNNPALTPLPGISSSPQTTNVTPEDLQFSPTNTRPATTGIPDLQLNPANPSSPTINNSQSTTISGPAGNLQINTTAPRIENGRVVNGTPAVATGTRNDGGAGSGSDASVGKTNNKGACFAVYGTNQWFELNVANCLAQFAYFILYLFSVIAGVAAWLLDSIIKYTVVNMTVNMNNISAINVGWAAIRDLINIGFIFILLYIAISTILGMNEHGVKHTLAKVIIFGILINFSMFFTKVIIDTSNILTLQFYTKINSPNNQGMGANLMQAFQLPSIYSATGVNKDTVASGDNARMFAARSEGTFVIFIMGIIMLITATGVIFGACWLFFKRFIAFIFLLVTSPVAFAGMILHSTEHQAKDWWHKLMSEAVAAPVFMILLWLAFKLIEGVNNVNGLSSSLGAMGASSDSSWGAQKLADALSSNLIFNFAIVTTLFAFTLIAAQKLGASGGDTALKISDWTKGKIYGGMGLMAGGVYRRQVAGRMRAISGSDLGKSLKNSVITGGIVKRNFARATLGVLDAGAKAKVGGAKTFDDQVKERQEELNKYLGGEHYSGKSIATVLNKGVTGNDVDKKAADNIHHDLKTEQHAEAYAFGGLDVKAKEKYYDDHGVGKMTLDTRAAVANKIKDGLPSHKKEFFDDKGAPLATFNQAKWEGMSDNQRRYVLENLTEDEAKKLDSVDNTLEKMLRVMMKKDKSGVENIVKSGKTDNLVKKIMGQSTVDIAIKSNLYDAYKAAEKNNPAEATRIAKHFEDHTGGEDVKKYEMNKDFDNERRTAEFYNKSLHRYVDFDSVADKKRKARLKVAVEVSKTAGETKEELKEDRVADKTGKAFAKYMKTP